VNPSLKEALRNYRIAQHPPRFSSRLILWSILKHSLEAELDTLTNSDPASVVPVIAALNKWASGVDSAITGMPKAERCFIQLREHAEEFISETEQEDRRFGSFLCAEIRKWTADLLGPAFESGRGASLETVPVSHKRQVFHAEGCRHIDRIFRDNLMAFRTWESARGAGFRPCEHCLVEYIDASGKLVVKKRRSAIK
jgi:hypothetical protein